MTCTGKKTYTTAIILAAGIGSRLGTDIPKQRMTLLGKSLVFRAVEPFYISDDVDSIVVVAREEDMDFVNNELHSFDKKSVVIVRGGACRAESAFIGFKSVPKETTHVAIHDGARCLITPKSISEVVKAAHEGGAASAASRITSTVKTIKNNRITATVSRDTLLLAQTPQVFSRELYSRAIAACEDLNSVTDDNMLIENIGEYITAVILTEENPKITYPEDLEYARFLIERRGACQDSE